MNSFPEWILAPDGKRIAFDPEAIYRSIFAAVDELGEPNSFLWRELTDAVLFHISSQISPITTSLELNELIDRILSELGYSELASGVQEWLEQPVAPIAPSPNLDHKRDDPFLRAIGEKASPQTLQQIAASDRFHTLSLSEVYPRELLAAAEEGLLVLTDLDAPLELMGWVWNGIRSGKTTELGILDSIWESRSHTSAFVAFDRPERLIINSRVPVDRSVDHFVQELRFALKTTNLHAFVNLNLVSNHSGKQDPDDVLFSDEILNQSLDQSISFDLLDSLITEPNVTVLFHLSSIDPILSDRALMDRLISAIAQGQRLELVFDRPRRPIVLGPGLDLQHPAVISCVGINLLRLIHQISSEPNDPLAMLKKIGSLSRLARSVGHCRRAFLRKNGRSTALGGFLLERSRLLLGIEGLWEFSQVFVGDAASSPMRVGGGAEKILKTVQEGYRLDSQRYLDLVIDTMPGGILPRSVTLPTFILPDLSLDQEIELVSELHRIAGAGLLVASLGNTTFSTIDIARTIRKLLRTEIMRFRFPHFSFDR